MIEAKRKRALSHTGNAFSEVFESIKEGGSAPT
jgi:hypothetical protein